MFTYFIGNKDALCTMVQGDVIFVVTNDFSIARRRYSVYNCMYTFVGLNLITDIIRNNVKYRILIYLLFSVFCIKKNKDKFLSNQLKNSYYYRAYVLLNIFITCFFIRNHKGCCEGYKMEFQK